MAKEKAKSKGFWEKNKSRIILVGGIAVGAALAAIGYWKGAKDEGIFIRDALTIRFDKPTALKELIGNGEILDKVCDAYGCTKDALIGGITTWEPKIIET